MTCREKLKIEYPDKVNPIADGGCIGCPNGYGYLPDPEYCKHIGDSELCTKCWDREIPGTEEIKEEVKMKKERRYYTCTEISTMSNFEKESLIARLQSDIACTNVECIGLRTSLRAKDVVIDDLHSTNDTLEERIKKLEKEKDDLDHILHNKIEALEGDIECRKKDLEYKNDQIDHLVERLDDQRKKIEDLENGDILPYFIRKVVGDKLKEDPCCWATPAKKRNCIEDPICKSVPCSETIKQLEKKVDDIPCIKLKDDYKNKEDYKKFEALMYTDHDIAITKYLADWSNRHQVPYSTIADHMMHKYKALRNAGFDHDTALGFIPMWSDD